MAEIKKISTELQLLDKFLDTSGDAGTSGQVLTSTGTGINWVSGGSLPGGPYLPLSAGFSYPLTGVLYIAGTIRNNSGDLEIRNQTASGFATATKLKQQTANGLETFLTLDGTSRNAYFTNQGNVGIGTTSPSEKLHVAGGGSGNIRLDSGGTYYGTNVQAISSAGLKIGNDDFSGYAFFHNDGNVGIGTTSPGAKLDVAGDVTANGVYTAGNSAIIYKAQRSGGAVAGDWSYDDATTDMSLGTSTAHSFSLKTGNTRALTINSSQNATFAGSVLVNGTNVTVANATNPYVYLNDTNAGAAIFQQEGNTTRIGSDSNTQVVLVQNNATAVTIDTSKNVGIGTTSPTARLDILTGSATGNNDIDRFVRFRADNGEQRFAFSVGRSGNNSALQMYDSSEAQKVNIASGGNSYFNGGNVGIGDANPTSISSNTFSLSVNSSRNDLSGALINKANGNIKHEQYWDSSGYGFRLAASSGDFIWKVNNSEKMRITSAGNVGIGTTSPGAKLDVTGSYGDVIKAVSGSQSITTNFVAPTTGSGRNNIISTAGEFNIGTSDAQFIDLVTSSISRMRINSNGNVGIGTTNPTNKLHVQGSQATVYSSTDTGGQASAGTTINNTNTAGNTNNFSQLLFTVGTNNNSVSRIVAIRSGSDASDLAFVGKSAAGVAEYMRIKSGGNVGIGTTSPGSSLEVLKSASSTTISEARISSLVTGGYGGQANLWLRTSVYGSAMLAFGPQVGSSTVASSASGKISYNTFTRVFTVTADSNALLTLGGSLDRVGINQTSPQYTLDVTGNGRFTSTVTATNFINSSDKRLKENIEEVCDNNVEVNWKTFNFKTEKQQKRYGVIAQELEKTNPEFVREDSQGFKSVAYIDLLIAKIAELEARIQKLEK